MKVLIFKKENDLKPVGGPNGYCFNIRTELKKRNNQQVCFLSDSTLKNIPFKSNSFKKYLNTFVRFLFGNKANINFNEYDAIHFHSTKELYENRKMIKKYKGKIVLTMHSPVPFHMEMVENIKNHHKFLGVFLRKHSFSFIDKKAFGIANYILLPCKEAEESYYSNWKYYHKLHDDNKEKYVYIQTGIVPSCPNVLADDYRKLHGFSKNDFIVSYIGRHNEIKGYDRIIKIANMVRNSNIKFLIGGTESPIKPPIMDNWTEIGWTNDPYSLINCSNVFILPNRETYFDIVLLEVLSLGKTCLISKTGGNKVILNNNCNGVFGFESEEQASEILLKLKNNNTGYLPNKNIKNLFNNNYDISIFVDRYLDFLERITKKD